MAKNRVLFIGFDIGSDTVHGAVLTKEEDVLYLPHSRMHFGNPYDALHEIYDDIMSVVDLHDVASFSFTGSCGKLIAEAAGCPYYYDTITIPAGVGVLHPEAEYVFHIGSTNPYFFVRTVQGDASFVTDHSTGTKCGGGSGILINKQVRRFFSEECPVRLKTIPAECDPAEKRRIPVSYTHLTLPTN